MYMYKQDLDLDSLCVCSDTLYNCIALVLVRGFLPSLSG